MYKDKYLSTVEFVQVSKKCPRKSCGRYDAGGYDGYDAGAICRALRCEYKFGDQLGGRRTTTERSRREIAQICVGQR